MPLADIPDIPDVTINEIMFALQNAEKHQVKKTL